jgi:hypothetical protein
VSSSDLCTHDLRRDLYCANSCSNFLFPAIGDPTAISP